MCIYILKELHLFSCLCGVICMLFCCHWIPWNRIYMQCELPDLGAETLTLVLYKVNMHEKPLSNLSNPTL